MALSKLFMPGEINMKHTYNNIRIITRTLLILSVLVILCPFRVNADITDNSVSTADEFFTALGHQMLDHKSQEFYYISSEELKEQLTVSKDLEQPFKYHYNPKEPLTSGCYTYLCLHDLEMTWFISRSRTLNVQMHFFVPKDTMQDYFEEMQKLADELKGENDYESVKAVHDYIIQRVEYDYNSIGQNYTDIEGFRENRMVCQGYSMASYVLLSDMGIPVRIVTGKGGNEKNPGPHAWNVVQVDGKWYNYDATWDDEGGNEVSYDYFLKGSNDFPNHYPEGLYNSSDFLNMISEESYYTPMEAGDMIFSILRAIIPLVLIIAAVLFIIKQRNSSTPGVQSAPAVGTVIEDDFDSFELSKQATDENS